MATEKEASPGSQEHPLDNDLQTVIRSPAVVDPGGIPLSTVETTVTSEPPTPSSSSETPSSQAGLIQHAAPVSAPDHIQSNNIPTSQLQTIISSIIQTNTNYTDSVTQQPTTTGTSNPDSVNNSEETQFVSRVDGIPPTSNTPSVIVLANPTLHNQGKQYFIQSSHHNSIDVPTSHSPQADAPLLRQSPYIPEALDISTSNSLVRQENVSVASIPVTLQEPSGSEHSLASAINLPTTTSGILLNNTQMILGNTQIHNHSSSSNFQVQQTSSSTPLAIPTSITSLPSTHSSHSIITTHPSISSSLSSSTPPSSSSPSSEIVLSSPTILSSQHQHQSLLAPPQSSQTPLASLSNLVLGSSIPQKDLMMRTSSGTPPLSASDVLMSSFNVLEDGDPVHRYQVHASVVSGNTHQHQDYVEPTSTPAYSHWSNSDLDHNRSAILKALQEPSQRTSNHSPSRQNHQAILNLNNTPANSDPASPNSQWVNYRDQIDGAKYTQMEVAEPESATFTSGENAVLPSVSPSYPNTATDGPTTALKSAFAGAHFLCKFCPERFRIPEKLTQHIKRVHSGSVVYTCFTCGKKFYNSHDLREHVPTHANEPIKCSLCNLTLESTKELRAHHKKAHPLSTMSCPLCDKVFGSSSARAKHLRAEHQEDKQLIVCEQCGDPFIDKVAYEEHKRTHRKTMQAIQSGQLTVTSQRQASPASSAVVIWKCDKCGLVFPNDSDLNHHTLSVHAPRLVNSKLAMAAIPDPSGQRGKLEQGPTTVPTTKYELLRLLLRRRKAAGEAANASVANASDMIENQPAYAEHADPSVTNQHDAVSRPPDELLSAEAMQHVAEELSLLQRMNQKKGMSVSSLETPITADNIIDPDSTMGINLTINKNASPASKVKEMQKHKTLVNMLQGTVASIIEREVKHPRTTRSISWNEQIHRESAPVSSVPTGVSYSAPVPKTATLEQFTSYNQGLTSCGGIIPSSAHIDNSSNIGLAMESSQMIPQTSVQSQYTVSNQSNFSSHLMPTPESAFQQELRSFLDMSQTISNPSDLTQVSQSQTLLTATRQDKPASSWDSHIGPLIKLFENVNPEVAKVPQGNQQPSHEGKSQELSYTIQDTRTPKPGEDDAILDLSSHRSNFAYDIGSQPTQMTSEVNQPQVTTGRLPHFNEVLWAAGREKNVDNLFEKQPNDDQGFYETYAGYTTPHSDINQMSGGHLTYVQGSQPQEAVANYYEHSVQGVQYVPSPEQEQISPDNNQRLQTSEGNLQILQDQHLNLLNHHETNHQDQRLLLQDHQDIHQLQQHHHVNTEGTQVLHGQYLEHHNDSFSQMLQENTSIMHIQNEPQLESLPTHSHSHISENSNSFPSQNNDYFQLTSPDRQNNNVLKNDGIPMTSEQHYMEPNNNKQDSEYQKMYDKFCKNTKPQYEGLRNMILARKFNPDVPLVVRHKLLATMLKEGGMEGQLSPTKEPDSTNDVQTNGLVSPTSNLQGIGVPVSHQMVTTYQEQNHPQNEEPYSGQDKLMMMDPKPVSSVKSDDTTVDHQLLSQIISEMPISSEVHSNQLLAIKKKDPPSSLLPGPNISRPLVGFDLGLQPEANPCKVGSTNNVVASPKEATSPLTDIQRKLSYEKGLGARSDSRRKKLSKPCPAIHKRRSTIVIQRAEDAFRFVDKAVHVGAEKRKHSCEELNCRVPKVAKPPTAKCRGRPPKNGQVPLKKGSYKKGKYPCPVCNKVYAWKNYLRIHIAKHEKEQHRKGNQVAKRLGEDEMPALVHVGKL